VNQTEYCQGWSKENVIEHIKSLSGTHFDPKAVELFLKMMSENEQNAG
jgi:response regulator RpfG family c-di-GMP phosphodiesterase